MSVGRVTVTRDGQTETVDGVVITDGPMITKDGINNYGKQITHLKSGGIYNEEDEKSTIMTVMMWGPMQPPSRT